MLTYFEVQMYYCIIYMSLSSAGHNRLYFFIACPMYCSFPHSIPSLLRYTPAARLSEVVYDSTLVTFTYDDASGMVKTIHLTHNGFISSIRYRQTGNPTRTHTRSQYIQCVKSPLKLSASVILRNDQLHILSQI